MLRSGLAALGLEPLLIGFILVELVSFTPPGRRWRDGGPAGRARLNVAALTLSLLLAAIQAGGLALTLELMVDRSGAPLVLHPGSAFRLIMVLTLTAATASLFALATAISEWGVGNGFCWLWALQTVEAVVRPWRLESHRPSGAEPTELLFGALCMLPVVALAAWVELGDLRLTVSTAAGETSRLRLPPLPQGILPVGWAESSATLVFSLAAGSHSLWLSRLAPLLPVTGRLLLIPAFSLIAYALFSTPRRLAANLRLNATVGLAAGLTAQVIRTTAYLTAGSVALYLVHHLIPASPNLAMTSVVVLTALVLDLRDEVEFTRRYGKTVRLLQLDNVHLASYLKALLGAQGIAVLARAYRFRSLFYFLNPLVKIDVRIAADRLDAAAALVAAQDLRTL
ncbi:MAG TPA: hypothetical protein VN999_05980 [Thermoanaerobaculia bacterium]|nr:hypothetical protein [Thermoanaerobaculia bacterium]